MNAKYETHEHDVLIIGAGGAGLRAAIEALAQGASVGVICKSLLGKAHTVMAEGGIAAAMGNVDKADDWRTHFRDTMRGGKFLSNWRMAQLHAQEAPERVRELEQWGALFDRTEDGQIKQCAPLFEFPHTFRRFLCMELRHPPVVQKFPAAHGVAKMRAPIVGLVDIAHGRSDSTLRHN